jgi:type I restriction enzyme, S subunit
MSSSEKNAKGKAMHALVPKLRFPEFRSTEAWTEMPLAVAADINPANSGLPESFIYIDLESVEAGELKLKNRIGRDGAPSRAQRRVERGDIIYQVVRPYQRNNLLCEFDDEEDYVASTGYAQLRAKGSNGFLYQSIHTDSFVSRVMAKCTGSNYPAINSSDLAEIRLPLPTTLAEQQKIAECLSSLDELLAAQARKVDVLKTHKKGLMQQLFPREGETQPRLRFPEFQSAGEWERKRFSDLCDIKHGYAFEGEFFSNEGDYVLLTPGNFYEEGGYRDRGTQQKYYVGEIPSDYVLAQGDMLIAMTEQAAGLLGSPILVPEPDKFLHNQRLGLLIKRPGVAWVTEFFFHVLNTQPVRKAIHDTASGTKVRHTSPTKVGDVVVSVPTTIAEQQRVAECLSSLDALITAETQALEAFEIHKKGLMQQLFPLPEKMWA